MLGEYLLDPNLVVAVHVTHLEARIYIYPESLPETGGDPTPDACLCGNSSSRQPSYGSPQNRSFGEQRVQSLHHGRPRKGFQRPTYPLHSIDLQHSELDGQFSLFHSFQRLKSRAKSRDRLPVPFFISDGIMKQNSQNTKTFSPN